VNHIQLLDENSPIMGIGTTSRQKEARMISYSGKKNEQRSRAVVPRRPAYLTLMDLSFRDVTALGFASISSQRRLIIVCETGGPREV
jgi:hypothetical protein